MPPGTKPILCYVTDRRAIERAAHPGPVLLEALRYAAAAGVDWIQIREKNLETRPLAILVRDAVEATRGTNSRILVNDRLDVALAAGAAGIHLGEASLPVEAVARWRRTAGRAEFQIGVSCHSADAARAAERDSADYIFFGPVFATPSKAAFGTPQGIARLREVCASTKIPVLAIGGVNLENAESCLAAGAAGIAAIRLFQEAPDAQGDVRRIVARLRGISTRTSF